MEKVINLFNGRHDFASFIPKSKSKLGKESEEFVDTIRVMEVFEFKKLNDFVWINEEKINSNISLWIFNIKAKSYFYNQVSRLLCHPN
jgi:tRNA U38,U39,U40 pseudouridine synthase TruA